MLTQRKVPQDREPGRVTKAAKEAGRRRQGSRISSAGVRNCNAGSSCHRHRPMISAHLRPVDPFGALSSRLLRRVSRLGQSCLSCRACFWMYPRSMVVSVVFIRVVLMGVDARLMGVLVGVPGTGWN
jgi:hypothetical protein